MGITSSGPSGALSSLHTEVFLACQVFILHSLVSQFEKILISDLHFQNLSRKQRQDSVPVCSKYIDIYASVIFIYAAVVILKMYEWIYWLYKSGITQINYTFIYMCMYIYNMVISSFSAFVLNLAGVLIQVYRHFPVCVLSLRISWFSWVKKNHLSVLLHLAQARCYCSRVSQALLKGSSSDFHLTLYSKYILGFLINRIY